ncbi:MAG: signal peptide peptidase SppA [Deltaproteobacteria bacterium]|nr:signal peptide peptidase SppA [Deltaproteobacteria bacterium]
MDKRSAWVIGIVFGGLFLCLFGFLSLVFLAVRDGEKRAPVMGKRSDRVGVVEILGEISDSKKVLKEFKAFAEDESVKAVVIRVDSPGGAVAPSQEIYDAVRRLSAKKKVVASMGSTAASGGYYIAAGAEKIFANPGTLTGSIGVIFQLPNVEGVLKWAGVQMNVVTAGARKDSGSPFREMRPDEREYFEALLKDVHEQFIQAVAEGRKLDPEVVRPLADGRVFSGRQARELKLVDELGGLQDAVEDAAKLAGIQGEPEVEYPAHDKKLLRELLGEEVDSLAQHAASAALRPLGGTGLLFRMPGVSGQ